MRYLVLDAESEDLIHDVLVDLVKGFPPVRNFAHIFFSPLGNNFIQNDFRQTLLLSAFDVGRLGDVAAVSLKTDHCELYPASDDK